ncbi:siderophore-interacting protein [Demequina muriae]|uniref:Siderophore-interacting protein n=1 Tax=Demequina muriae TaxID=3051664 RepID=A0ABT8GGA0_9MICO|nr:siderophore-interacting protein [Demequina sp. EGI L300058]MDN4480291.1 siderophore-interacting protein [Demequina sp. EGI L300058]
MGDKRPLRTVRVLRTERLSPSTLRVIVGGPDLAELPPLEFTDHYVKLRFGDVKRTYTIRWLDAEALEMALDFVIHGDEGLAGPWAARAQPGDDLRFVGPGGKWAPRPDADAHVLVGDEAAMPAIAAALEAMPTQAVVRVYLEVASAADRQALPVTDRTEVTWVHRDELGMAYGEALTYAVQSAAWPEGDVEVFVHGNADMIKPLRRHLFHDLAVPKDRVSISGYWRTGMNEDGWQSSKAEFVAQMEAEQDGLSTATDRPTG